MVPMAGLAIAVDDCILLLLLFLYRFLDNVCVNRSSFGVSAGWGLFSLQEIGLTIRGSRRLSGGFWEQGYSYSLWFVFRMYFSFISRDSV